MPPNHASVKTSATASHARVPGTDSEEGWLDTGMRLAGRAHCTEEAARTALVRSAHRLASRMNETLQIRRADLSDLPAVSRLAHDIWHRHYPGIITRAQIDYMLTVGY